MLFTWKRARLYGLLVCALFAVAYVNVTLEGRPPFNSSHEPIGGDYIAFYTAGRLVLQGEAAQVYDHDRVAAVEAATLQQGIPDFYDAYRNPPFYALLYAPLAALDVIPSFVVWSVLGLLALGLALMLAPRPRGARFFDLAVLALAFGPVYFGLIDGENAALSLLLYVLIYRALVRDRSAQAGVLSALGLFKPQLFFIWPLVFLATRRWRALAWYLATACGLLVVSLAVVGPDGLQAWLRVLLDMETGNATRNAWRMHSLKAFFDLLLPFVPAVALALYVACAAVLLALVVRVWHRRPIDLALPVAFTCLVAVLVDPHLVDYDLTVLVLPALLAIPRLPRLRWLVLALYPLLLLRAQVPLGDARLQLSVLALVLFAFGVWRAADAASRSARPNRSASARLLLRIDHSHHRRLASRAGRLAWGPRGGRASSPR